MNSKYSYIYMCMQTIKCIFNISAPRSGAGQLVVLNEANQRLFTQSYEFTPCCNTSVTYLQFGHGKQIAHVVKA